MMDELRCTLRGLLWTALACHLVVLAVPITILGGLQDSLFVRQHSAAMWLSLCVILAAVGAVIIRRGVYARAFVVAWTIAAIVGTGVLSMLAAKGPEDWNVLTDRRVNFWTARDLTGILAIAVLLAISVSSRATKALQIRGLLLMSVGMCVSLSLLTASITVVFAVAIIWYFGLVVPLIGCGLMLGVVWGWLPTVIRQSRFYRAWRVHAPRSLASDTPTAS